MTPALRLRPRGPVDDAAEFGRDAAEFGRRVRDMAVDGTTQFARRADIPHLVEVGRDSAATAVTDAMDRVAGRRRRRRPNPVLLIAIAVALGLGAWWLVRLSGIASLRAMGEDDIDDDDLGAAADQAIEADALSRATNEGMGPADARAQLVPADGGPHELANEFGDPRPVVGIDPY